MGRGKLRPPRQSAEGCRDGGARPVTISVLTIVDRGAPIGARCCEGCRQRGEVLREVRIPYSGAGSYWRDLCPCCIDALRWMPRLPEQHGAQDKAKADAAFEKALAVLQRAPTRVGGLRAWAKGDSAKDGSEAMPT